MAPVEATLCPQHRSGPWPQVQRGGGSARATCVRLHTSTAPISPPTPTRIRAASLSSDTVAHHGMRTFAFTARARATQLEPRYAGTPTTCPPSAKRSLRSSAKNKNMMGTRKSEITVEDVSPPTTANASG